MNQEVAGRTSAQATTAGSIVGIRPGVFWRVHSSSSTYCKYRAVGLCPSCRTASAASPNIVYYMPREQVGLLYLGNQDTHHLTEDTRMEVDTNSGMIRPLGTRYMRRIYYASSFKFFSRSAGRALEVLLALASLCKRQRWRTDRESPGCWRIRLAFRWLLGPAHCRPDLTNHVTPIQPSGGEGEEVLSKHPGLFLFFFTFFFFYPHLSIDDVLT